VSCNCHNPEAWQLLEVLAQSRTVCVERFRNANGHEVVRKTYLFPTAKDRRRGMLRGTWLGQPKVERELTNLNFLQRANVPAVEAVHACVTRNMLGFIVASHLLTQATAGTTLADLIRTQKTPEPQVWTALGHSLSRMHQARFWHRGLAPRNVLIQAQAPFHAWLDPAKSKISTKPLSQAARADDLLRFWYSLTKHVPATHKQAFEQAYGQEGVSDPETLWPAIPKGKRASTTRILRRDEARLGLQT
jgi:tRNA A-37 threonylcarbamoyl transferase component Bud32